MAIIVGIDEAGRGPLAGPVSVGVFVAEEQCDLDALIGIRDSKTLSEKQREVWYDKLINIPQTWWAVEFSPASVIDSDGIQSAVQDALNRALVRLAVPTSGSILLDGGLHAPSMYKNQKTIIHGDAIEPLISAAAILAKVTRDRHMVALGFEYPAYDFAIHKGYGTKIHRYAIKTHGLCAEHRASFCTRIV